MCQAPDREAGRRQHPPDFTRPRESSRTQPCEVEAVGRAAAKLPPTPPTPGTGKATEDRPAGDRRELPCPLWPLGETVPLQHRAPGAAADPAALTAHVGPRQAWGRGRRGDTLRGAASASSTCSAPGPAFSFFRSGAGVKGIGIRQENGNRAFLLVRLRDLIYRRHTRILALERTRRAAADHRGP